MKINHIKCSGQDPKGHTKNQFDDLPTKESMRRPYIVSGDPKETHIKTGPLNRWLTKQVGRRWDEVYSELCERHNPELLKLLEWKIVITPEIIDGEFWFDGYKRPYYHDGKHFYIEDGILRLVPQIKRQRRDKKPYSWSIDGRQYKKIEGIWYEITIEWDFVYRQYIIAEKRQLNTREIDRLGLRGLETT